MVVELEGYRSIFANSVYLKDSIAKNNEQQSIDELILLKKCRYPTNQEMKSYIHDITQTLLDFHQTYKGNEPAIAAEIKKKFEYIEKEIYTLIHESFSTDLIEHLEKETVPSFGMRPPLFEEEQPYTVIMKYGTINQSSHQKTKDKGHIFEPGWYDAFFHNPEIKSRGYGLQCQISIQTKNNMLPPLSSKEYPSIIAEGNLNTNEIQAFLDLLYDAFPTKQHIDLIPDTSSFLLQIHTLEYLKKMKHSMIKSLIKESENNPSLLWDKPMYIPPNPLKN